MKRHLRGLTTLLTPLVALGPAIIVSGTALAQAAEPAPADPAPTAEQLDQARTLFIAGSTAYRETRYAVAIKAFEEAFALAPRASIMFALAQANRLQYFVDGDIERIEDAVEHYRQYLERDDTDPAQSELAVRHLASLNPQLARMNRKRDDSIARIIVSSATAGATVRIGDEPPQEVPAAFELPPGPVVVRVEAPGHAPQTREVMAVGGTGLPLNVPLAPLPGVLAVNTEPGARVMIDGRSLGMAPLPPQELPPGPHRVVVLASGRQAFANTVQLEATREVQLEAPLDVTFQRTAAWSTFGLAGVLAATGVITGVLAVGAEADAQALSDLWEDDALTPDQVETYNRHLEDRDLWYDRTLGLGIGAAVAVGLGAALWLFDEPRAPNMPLLTPTVAPGASGAGLSGQFRF